MLVKGGTGLQQTQSKWCIHVLCLQPCTEIPWWRHHMERFSALLAICAGNSPVTGTPSQWETALLCNDVSHWLGTKAQWRGALMFSLICAWINVWVNNREAGDLRRHRAHYYVTVMRTCSSNGVLTLKQLDIKWNCRVLYNTALAPKPFCVKFI